jgi:hypothetical protein
MDLIVSLPRFSVPGIKVLSLNQPSFEPIWPVTHELILLMLLKMHERVVLKFAHGMCVPSSLCGLFRPFEANSGPI